jgi:hypothetical protein
VYILIEKTSKIQKEIISYAIFKKKYNYFLKKIQQKKGLDTKNGTSKFILKNL